MSTCAQIDLKHYIRNLPDYPAPGILFRDITPLLADAAALAAATAAMAAPWREKGVTKVAALEARGFLFATSVALALGAGLIPVRKQGKLPWRTRTEAYALEYGSDVIEVHEDAAGPADRVLLIDDLIATGGSALAAIRLLRGLGAPVIGAGFLIDLADLGGAERLLEQGIACDALLTYRDAAVAGPV